MVTLAGSPSSRPGYRPLRHDASGTIVRFETAPGKQMGSISPLSAAAIGPKAFCCYPGILESSKHMDSSANQQGLFPPIVRSAADSLGQRLEQVTQQIEQAGSQNAALTDQLKQKPEMLARLQDGLLQGAEWFEQAASEARHGFCWR